MKFWSRMSAAWQVATGQAQELDLGMTSDNPYAVADAQGEMMFEAFDASIHALWPLITASAHGGLMAYRGVVYGVLKSVTLNEDHQDHDALAWSVARVIWEYLDDEQAAMDMPGISLHAEGPDRIDAELIGFIGAAIDGEFEDAVSVLRTVRSRHAPWVLDRRPDVDDMEEAEERVVVEFLGSILASTATRYVLDVLEDPDDDGE